MSAHLRAETSEGSLTLDDFLAVLDDDFGLFRYAMGDLMERYGETYTKDAAFIIASLEKFAASNNHTLPQVIRLYADFIKQVLEDYRLFAQTGRYLYTSEGEIEHIVSDERFQLDYLYILTLSTLLNRSRYEVYLHFRNMVSRHLREGSLCLDIGGGNCLDSMCLSNYGRVDVFERNKSSLSWQEILGIGNKVDLRIEYYTFNDHKKYDFVSMIELLEHVSAPAQYLSGAHKVLKDGGCAYFTFAIRMPQFDHLYQFNSVEECRELLHNNGFKIVEDFCTINTHQPFKEEERWALANNPRLAITYCCFVRKQSQQEMGHLIDEFNDDLESYFG